MANDLNGVIDVADFNHADKLGKGKEPGGKFVASQEASARRQALVNQYVSAFRHVEANALDQARTTLKSLATNVSQWVVPNPQAVVTRLVDDQLAKLA